MSSTFSMLFLWKIQKQAPQWMVENSNKFIQYLTFFSHVTCYHFIFNQFHATDLFWYLLKASENLWFSDVFRGYQNKSVVWNGLIDTNFENRINKVNN